MRTWDEMLGVSEMHEPMRSELRERLATWAFVAGIVILFLIMLFG